jgi:sensor domain CHASE-containing protein
LQVIGKLLLAILPRAEISKGGKVLPAAQIRTAGETNRSRWNHARIRLLIPIGIMVVVAIIGIAVGVLSSAQRANRISTDNEEQAIVRSLEENAERALRHLESVATMPQATTKIRDSYDAAWIDRRVGEWLETFYNADIVVVFGASGDTEYLRSRIAGDEAPADLAAELAPAIDILRGRLAGQPRRTVLVSPRHLSKPTNAVALFQDFLGRSAIVAAVAVGERESSANANARAPIVALVKYVSDRLLTKIADHLQVDDLRLIDAAMPSSDDQVVTLADAEGQAVVRLSWRAKRPGGAVIVSFVPFVALALIAFALLLVIIVRHMRRTAAAIADGERQLRHLALHDPVCGLPNRIYFSERLERAIAEVRNGGPTAAVF